MSPLRTHHRREAGAALLVAMLMMALMAALAFAALEIVMRDREVAGGTSRTGLALSAADAGIAASLRALRSNATGAPVTAGECAGVPVPTGTLGNGTTFGPDSTAPSTMCMIARAEPCFANSSLDLPYNYAVWNIRVQGEAAGGSVARVQATAAICQAFN